MNEGHGRRAVVVGSINVDHVAGVDHLCAPGETVIATSFATHPGGKGANQAVAIARAGSPVAMVGCVGDDLDGRLALETLRGEGVDVASVKILTGIPTGRAFVQVAAAGENAICVVPGANSLLSPQLVPRESFATQDVIVLQGEIPKATLEWVISEGHAAGARVILNLAPWFSLPDDILAKTTVLVLNEVEAANQLATNQASVLEDPEGSARALASYCGAAVITLGERGAVWGSGHAVGRVFGHDIRPIDTTGAGDAFVGYLAASLVADWPLEKAVDIANAAGALATLRHGAVPSLPRQSTTERFLAGGKPGGKVTPV